MLVYIFFSLFFASNPFVVVYILSKKGVSNNVTTTPYNYKDDYNEYMQSYEWRKKRLRVIKRDGKRCRLCGVCGTERTLHVHHLQYGNPIGTEHERELITLCDRCHAPQHKSLPKLSRNEKLALS